MTHPRVKGILGGAGSSLAPPSCQALPPPALAEARTRMDGEVGQGSCAQTPRQGVSPALVTGPNRRLRPSPPSELRLPGSPGGARASADLVPLPSPSCHKPGAGTCHPPCRAAPRAAGGPRDPQRRAKRRDEALERPPHRSSRGDLVRRTSPAGLVLACRPPPAAPSVCFWGPTEAQHRGCGPPPATGSAPEGEPGGGLTPQPPPQALPEALPGSSCVCGADFPPSGVSNGFNYRAESLGAESKSRCRSPRQGSPEPHVRTCHGGRCGTHGGGGGAAARGRMRWSGDPRLEMGWAPAGAPRPRRGWRQGQAPALGRPGGHSGRWPVSSSMLSSCSRLSLST